MTYSLFCLKNAKLYGKRKKCSLFSVDNASRFHLPNCQSLNNSYLENFFVLISLAKNLIFEYWLAPSWVSLGLKLKNVIYFVIFPQKWQWIFFVIYVVSEVIISFHNKKNNFYHISNDFSNFPRGGPRAQKVQYLKFGKFRTLKKKFLV